MATDTEIQILEERANKLETMVEHYTSKYKQLASKHETSEETVNKQKLEIKRLQDLCDDYTTKYNEIVSKNELLTLHKQFGQQISQNDENSSSKQLAKEKELMEQLKTAQNAIKEKDRIIDAKYKIIDNLADQLQIAKKYQEKNGYLQMELNTLNEMAVQDMSQMDEEVDKLRQEIITLTAENRQLDTEKDDLMGLLEERDHENQMLKTGNGLNRANDQHVEFMGNVYDDLDDGLSNKMSQEIMMWSTKCNALQEERDELAALLEDTEYNQQEKATKDVADVTREYLHLTASVVNMKFPNIQHISSEELVNKVKNYQFWEYHDMMIRIMKTEENRMKEMAQKKKEEKANMIKDEKGVQDNMSGNGGVLGSFRNFFGGHGGVDQKEKLKKHRTSITKLKDQKRNSAKKYPKTKKWNEDEFLMVADTTTAKKPTQLL